MFYPIMIDINDKDIVVVGGGEVAYSKSVKLLEFGANIKVLSPTKTDKFGIKRNIQGEIKFYMQCI